MFSIEIVQNGEYFNITLHYKSDTINFEFCPENAYGLTGDKFRGTESNGTCSLTWNEETIKFEVGKYGDGEGGDLKIVLSNSGEIKRSFSLSIESWMKAIAK
jgi:hypothetical protein